MKILSRFSLQILFDGKLIETSDRRGRKYTCARDFNCKFFDPEFYGNNKMKDNTLIQNSKNEPHPYEEEIFENSWQAVEMGETLVELMRFIMREGTEDFYQQGYEMAKMTKSLDSFKLKGNKDSKFTIQIVDRTNPIRDEEGKTKIPYKVIEKYHKLGKIKNDYNRKISNRQMEELEVLYNRVSENTIERVIYSVSFSASEFSYDNENFSPPIAKVWKRFNALFDKKYKEIEQLDLDEFQSVRNDIVYNETKKSNILAKLQDENLTAIDKGVLRSELSELNETIAYHSGYYFDGLLNNIISAFKTPKHEFVNRFLNPKVVKNVLYAY